MARVFISDGYTLDGKIPFHGEEVTIKYRPALPAVTAEFVVQRKDSGKDYMKHVVKLLKDHLVSWNLTDDQDKETTPDEEHLTRVPKPLLDMMIDFVCSYSTPEARKDAKNS